MSLNDTRDLHFEKPPSAVWLWGAFLSLALALIAATVGEWLYNSKRHDASLEDRKQIRANQQRIAETLERIEAKVGRK